MTVANGHGEVARRTKLLTFESWVTRATWYDCALAHPEVIPFPLIDRSPCQDPFFDPFAAPEDRRPVISGLCRGRAMRNFGVGDCFIYITRIDPRIVQRFASGTVAGPHYFAVAALRVVRVWPSHQIAATDFTTRRVCLPAGTYAIPAEPRVRGPSRGCGRKRLLDRPRCRRSRSGARAR